MKPTDQGNATSPRKPRIAISTTTGQELSGPLPGYPRINVSSDYVEAVVLAGGVPMMVPLVIAGVDDLDALAQAQLEGMDALVLTGGQDIEPSNYGQTRREGCGSSLPGRDAFDLALLAEAMRRKIPILGICRGFQIINVALSGTLFQDLPTERPSGIAHWQTAAPDQTSHPVEVVDQTRLRVALGAAKIDVTSYHHQGVDQLGNGLVVSATAPDGLIEAFESPADEPWMLAVQWHPEMSHRIDAAGRAIFKSLIEAASR